MSKEQATVQSSTPEMGQSVARNSDELMAAWISQVLCCAIRGVIGCFPHVQVEKVLIVMSAVMGQQIAHTYAGDDLAVHKLRKTCRDSFETGIKSVAVTPLNRPKSTDTASIGSA